MSEHSAQWNINFARIKAALFHVRARKWGFPTELKNDCACVTSDPVSEAVGAKISTWATHSEWKTIESVDFAVQFQLVFRCETVVFRRYVLSLLLVVLLRKFEAYLVNLSLNWGKFPWRLSCFQKFRHFSYMFPGFPARISDMRSRFSALLGLPHFDKHEKAIWRHLWSIQNEAIPLVVMCWQRIVIGLGKSRDWQTWLECRFSWNENLQRRKNWTSKSTFLKENARKVESVFVIRSAQWAEKLGCCLDYCKSWKIRSENLRLRSTWRPFDLSFERKGALVKVEICVLCGRWFSNQFESELRCSWRWAVLCSLLCRELDLNIRIGKQSYVFIWL